METHHRAECTVFKPSHQQFLECGVFRISSMEAANVRSPPGNPCHSHIQPGRQLIPQAGKAGVNIPRPYQRPVSLGARPCTAKQINDIFLPLRLHAVKKCFCIKKRIAVPDLYIRPHIITVIVKIVNTVFRLRLIQPENLYPFLIIIFLRLLPYIFPGFRVGSIIVDGVSLEVHCDTEAPVGANQIALLLHLLKVLAPIVHRRPNGNHQFYSHPFQFFYHAVRVRPVF